MIRQQDVRFLSTVFILLSIIFHVTSAKPAGSNEERGNLAKVSSLVGYFEKLKGNDEMNSFKERPKSVATAPEIVAAAEIGNEREPRGTLDVISPQDGLGNEHNSLRELQELLDKERSKSENLAGQLEKALSVTGQYEQEISTLQKDLNKIDKEMELKNKLISSLSTISKDAEDKLKQKDKELSDLKQGLCSIKTESADRQNEMRNSYESKLATFEKQVAMMHECGNQLAETKRSLSTCEVIKDSQAKEINKLTMDRNEMAEELDKLQPIKKKYELEEARKREELEEAKRKEEAQKRELEEAKRKEDARRKAYEEANRREQQRRRPPCPYGDPNCQVDHSRDQQQYWGYQQFPVISDPFFRF